MLKALGCSEVQLDSLLKLLPIFQQASASKQEEWEINPTLLQGDVQKVREMMKKIEDWKAQLAKIDRQKKEIEFNIMTQKFGWDSLKQTWENQTIPFTHATTVMENVGGPFFFEF